MSNDHLKRMMIAAIGGAALLHLLSTVGVEFFAMSSVEPSRLDSRVSSWDFWLMMTCIGSLAISGVLLLATYLDVILLGSRFPRSSFWIAVVATAIVLVWGVASFFALENLPAFKTYLESHLGVLGAGAVAAVLMLFLAKGWPTRIASDGHLKATK